MKLIKGIGAILNFWKSPSEPATTPQALSESTVPSAPAATETETSDFSAEQQNIAAKAKMMVTEFESLYRGTELDGKSREEIYEVTMECRRRFNEITELLEQHTFLEWKARGECDNTLRVVEIDYQPLYQRQNGDSTLVAVVDTETTGLGEHDEPVSVGVVLLDVSGPKGDCIVELDAYYGLREPKVPIHPQALRVHGLGMEKLLGQSFDMQRLRKLVDSADLLVAHNAKFDRRMLGKLIPRVITAEWACSIYTLKYDWAKITSGQQSLDAICKALSIERPEPHNALSDCRALVSVLMTRGGSERRSSTRMARLIQNAWAPAP